ISDHELKPTDVSPAALPLRPGLPPPPPPSRGGGGNGHVGAPARSPPRLPPLFLPSPAAVVKALETLWIDGTLMVHVTASLKRIVPGWIIGTAAGLAV